MARVSVRSEVITSGELNLVSPSHLKEALRALQDNPKKGKPLLRELSGYRSIRVEGENRIVYRLKGPDDDVEIVCIGRRRDDEVYQLASRRA